MTIALLCKKNIFVSKTIDDIFLQKNKTKTISYQKSLVKNEYYSLIINMLHKPSLYL